MKKKFKEGDDVVFMVKTGDDRIRTFGKILLVWNSTIYDRNLYTCTINDTQSPKRFDTIEDNIMSLNKYKLLEKLVK